MTGKRYFYSPPGKPFEKGESPNPGGIPNTPQKLRGQPKLTRTQLCEAANDLLARTIPELQDVMRDKSSPALDVMLASVIIHIAKHGDMQRLNALLDRLIGKVKETVEVTTPKPFIMRLPGGDLMVMGTKASTDDDTDPSDA